jgi:hypothetical protein
VAIAVAVPAVPREVNVLDHAEVGVGLVNLSTREFFHPKLVAEVLAESEIDPATL